MGGDGAALTQAGGRAGGTCAFDSESQIRVLILTSFELDEYVFGALKAGASGFLLKDTLPEDLLAGVRIIAG